MDRVDEIERERSREEAIETKERDQREERRKKKGI
jgi:hypothetical protein